MWQSAWGRCNILEERSGNVIPVLPDSLRRPSAQFFFLRTIDRILPSIHLTFLAMLLVHFYSRPIFSNEQDKKPNTASIVSSRYPPYKSFNTQTRTFEGTILSFSSFDAFAWSFACDKMHQRVTIGCVLVGKNKTENFASIVARDKVENRKIH